jgi:hypothetical protein
MYCLSFQYNIDDEEAVPSSEQGEKTGGSLDSQDEAEDTQEAVETRTMEEWEDFACLQYDELFNENDKLVLQKNLYKPINFI